MARARQEDWEGLIVKLARSPYRAGKRSPEWMKLKLQKQDEFVIGGWTAPQGTRVHFGALILGAKGESGTLEYVGDVGTGFTGAELDRLMGLLKRIETPTCPFAVKPKVKDTAALGQAGAGRAGALHGDDRRRPPAASRLPGPSG